MHASTRAESWAASTCCGSPAVQFAHGAIQWLAADNTSVNYIVSGLAFRPKFMANPSTRVLPASLLLAS